MYNLLVKIFVQNIEGWKPGEISMKKTLKRLFVNEINLHSYYVTADQLHV